MSLRTVARFLTISLITLSCVALVAPAANAATTSEIAKRYNSDAALRTMLGASKSNEYSVAGGREHDYQWGSLYWSSATGVHEVHGAIWARYKNLGGPAGKLGFPKTDEQRVYIKTDVPEQQLGARSYFANGSLIWSKDTNKTIWIGKKISDFLPIQTFPYYGIPDADQHAASQGSQVASWAYGRIYVLANGSLIFMNDGYPGGSDGLLAAYGKLGFDTGVLGLPTANEELIDATSVHEEGRVQKFQGGVIYQRGHLLSDKESYVVRGAIYWAYSHSNGLETLGFPVGNEQAANGGRVQYFQHGNIFWNSSTNATKITRS